MGREQYCETEEERTATGMMSSNKRICPCDTRISLLLPPAAVYCTASWWYGILGWLMHGNQCYVCCVHAPITSPGLGWPWRINLGGVPNLQRSFEQVGHIWCCTLFWVRRNLPMHKGPVLYVPVACTHKDSVGCMEARGSEEGEFENEAVCYVDSALQKLGITVPYMTFPNIELSASDRPINNVT